MTWLTVTEYRRHILVLSSFKTYHWVCNKSNTTGATCGAWTAYLWSSPWFLVRLIVLEPYFCVMFCRSLFARFLLTIVLSALLRFAVSDCPFGIFKLFEEEQ